MGASRGGALAEALRPGRGARADETSPSPSGGRDDPRASALCRLRRGARARGALRRSPTRARSGRGSRRSRPRSAPSRSCAAAREPVELGAAGDPPGALELADDEEVDRAVAASGRRRIPRQARPPRSRRSERPAPEATASVVFGRRGPQLPAVALAGPWLGVSRACPPRRGLRRAHALPARPAARRCAVPRAAPPSNFALRPRAALARAVGARSRQRVHLGLRPGESARFLGALRRPGTSPADLRRARRARPC
jgi:hypothetical protein